MITDAYKEAGLVGVLLVALVWLGKWMRDMMQDRRDQEARRTEELAAKVEQLLQERAADWVRQIEEKDSQLASLHSELTQVKAERDRYLSQLLAAGGAQ